MINRDWNIASAQETLVTSLLTSHCGYQLLCLQTLGLCPMSTDRPPGQHEVLGVTLKHLMCGIARPFCGSHGVPAPDAQPTHAHPDILWGQRLRLVS